MGLAGQKMAARVIGIVYHILHPLKNEPTHTMISAPPASRGLNHGIGLALSGGGYRAAAYHLGTLSYLHRMGLLGQVEALSTVSGGTFTGAAYAISLVEGASFEHFFRDFYGFLSQKDLLIRQGLDGLSREQPGVPSKRRGLNVSMASVYAGPFLRRPDGSTYLFGDLMRANLPLKEIVFNTTEFKTGKAFRFQVSATRGLIGNRDLSITREEAAQIRLADIVAASSCFPGGFEPFAFPYDFAWPGGVVPDSLLQSFSDRNEPAPVGLMDGGIYDNQGVDSLLLAERRDRNNLDEGESPDTDPMGLLLISDVDQASDDLYAFPDLPVGSRLTLGAINALSWVVLAVAAVSGAVLAYQFLDNLASGQFVTVALQVVPLALTLLVAAGIYWGRRRIKAAFGMIPHVEQAIWNDIKGLTVTQIVEMGVLRVSSLMAMSARIFLKRIRQMSYNNLYDDPDYAGRQLASLIYDLRPGNNQYQELKREVRTPSEDLYRVVSVAADMPTTLWYTEDYQLPCLVATGQATLCYNLMKYIASNYELEGAIVKNPDAPRMPMTPDVQQLWDRLLADWNTLRDDPYALLRPATGVAELKPPPRT